MPSLYLLLVVSIFVATSVIAADAANIGCPTGQALQSVNVRTGKLVCVPTGGTGAQLVDRDDVVIGQYLGNGNISRELMGYRVDICCIATTSGGADPLIGPSPLYSSADCQGTPYFFADPRIPDPLFRVGTVLESGDIVFGGDPVTTIVPRSFFDELEGCIPITEPVFGSVPVHPVVSVPLSSLGAPPYKVK
jgi:hypothetical protein